MTKFTKYVDGFDLGLLLPHSEIATELPHRSIGRPYSQERVVGQGITIEWPQTEHGRARKVISRAGVRRRYIVACFRGGDRQAHGEAQEEAFAAELLDACAGIEFQDQPAIIRFEWNQELVIHCPDLLVVGGGIKEFWECKRDYEAHDLYVRRRTELLQALLKPIGFGYRLVSTSQLQYGSYHQNAVRMRRRAKFDISISLLRQCRELPSTGAKARAVLSSIDVADRLDILYALIYGGWVSANLFHPIGLDMNVGPPMGQGGTPWVWELFGKAS